MSYLAKAIHHLRPESQFIFENEDYSTIQWHILEGKAPTEAEIKTAIEEVKARELQEQANLNARKAELLAKLGITEDEARLLLS